MKKNKSEKGFSLFLLIGAVFFISAIGVVSYEIVEYNKSSNIIKESEQLTNKEKYDEATGKLEGVQNKFLGKTILKQKISGEMEEVRALSEDKSEYIEGVHEFNKDNFKKAVKLFSKISGISPYYLRAQNRIKETQEKIEAAKLEKIEDCEKLFPLSQGAADYNSCLRFLAMKKKNTDICNSIDSSEDEIILCKTNVAISANDVSICEKISASRYQEVSRQKDICFAYFAIAYQDKNICYKISDQDYYLERCLSGIEAHANSPFLGVSSIGINKVVKIHRDLPVDYGALVEKSPFSEEPAIFSGSPADRAGLKEGDIILEINGTKIDEENYLQKILSSFKVGDEITLKILRNNKEMETKLILGSRPQPKNKQQRKG